MKKVMYPIEVSHDVNHNISLEQKINDLNEPDPVITISKEQAGIIASWILEAAEYESDHEIEDMPVLVNFYSRGPEAESEELSIFNNPRGMIVLKIDDDTFIEVSPQMAKRMRVQLTKAISTAIGSLFVPDEEA